MEDEQTPVEQEVVTEKEEISPDQNPLTPELISQNISLIGRTANGLSHAYLRLELHDKEITNTAGITKFPHLRYLDLSDNHLVAFNEVGTLTHLLSLNLQNNFLVSATPLDQKKYLQQLNFAKNKLVDWTISLPHCSFLNLNENKLTEQVRFDDYPELLHLELRGNRLKSTPSVLNAPKLQRLYLGANGLENMRFGSDLQYLSVLHLRGNNIETLEGLENLVSLNYLNLRQNKVEKMDQVLKLTKLPSLRTLVLVENPIEQIENYRLAVVGELPKLDRLDKEPISPEEREDAYQLKAASEPKGE